MICFSKRSPHIKKFCLEMQLASLSNHDDDEGNDPNKTRQKFNEENKNFEQTNVLNIIIN